MLWCHRLSSDCWGFSKLSRKCWQILISFELLTQDFTEHFLILESCRLLSHKCLHWPGKTQQNWVCTLSTDNSPKEWVSRYSVIFCACFLHEQKNGDWSRNCHTDITLDSLVGPSDSSVRCLWLSPAKVVHCLLHLSTLSQAAVCFSTTWLKQVDTP